MSDNRRAASETHSPQVRPAGVMRGRMRGPGGGGPGGGMRGVGKPKDTRKTVAGLFRYLRPQVGRIILALLLVFASTAAMLASSYAIRPLINDYILPGDLSGLARALLVLGSIMLAGSGASYMQSRIIIRVAQGTAHTMRRDLFAAMQKLPVSYFDTHSHGELMSRYTNDIDNIQFALEQGLMQLLSGALILIGSVALMLLLSPLLFIAVALVLALMVFLSTAIGKRTRRYFQEQQKTLGAMNGYIEEMIEGLREVKIFNREAAATDDFAAFNSEYRKSATSAAIFSGIIMPVMHNLNNMAYALIAVFGGLLTVAGRFDIGSLGAFLQLSRQVGQPISQITMQVNNIFSALAGAERVFEVMAEQPETDEGLVELIKLDKALTVDGQRVEWAWRDNDALIPLRGDVRLIDVDFAYDPRKPVLKNISLYAKPGQKIAFVGSTGAGKTTIANLLNRFYDVDAGRITYDDVDVRRIKKDDLRRALGMVLQDTHLFTGTVLENIRYGRLLATDEECMEAARAVSADGFIRRLPRGYQTVITGDGTNLSQGQRQLLALARAYVADPPVMLLDEATSSIDTRTERLIEQGMDKLMEHRTVFVIAHRLSTIRNARAILVLEDGEIIERGDHDELLTQQGRYYKLHTGQQQLS
ncbi:MAG: ABC transporter ATP-binding protein/permease [Clostridiales bacterium]|nr:ABC transporter ATP-binding protein/permease [Clostridiales bacterium]